VVFTSGEEKFLSPNEKQIVICSGYKMQIIFIVCIMNAFGIIVSISKKKGQRLQRMIQNWKKL